METIYFPVTLSLSHCCCNRGFFLMHLLAMTGKLEPLERLAPAASFRFRRVKLLPLDRA